MHTAFLDRLAAKGVNGKAWRLVDAMYRNAASRVRLQGKLSAQFDVRCGVAQGCPLSPFLYAVFSDGLLDAVQGECAGDGLPVGDAQLAGQSYADDTVDASGTPLGLQRIIDVMNASGTPGGAWQT